MIPFPDEPGRVETRIVARHSLARRLAAHTRRSRALDPRHAPRALVSTCQPLCSRALTAAGSAAGFADLRLEIHPALVEIHLRQPHPHAIRESERTVRALASQPVPHRIEMEVVGSQRADVHKAFDEYVVEGDEDSEGGDPGDRRIEHLAQLVQHELALEPRDRVARRVVGPALGHRAVVAEHRQGRTPSRLEVTGTATPQRVADRTMHDEIGITSDRRGEMGRRHGGRDRSARRCPARTPPATVNATSRSG